MTNGFIRSPVESSDKMTLSHFTLRILKDNLNLIWYPLESYVPYMAHEDLQGAPFRIPNKIT